MCEVLVGGIARRLLSYQALMSTSWSPCRLRMPRSYRDLRGACRAVCDPSLYNVIRCVPGMMGRAVEEHEKGARAIHLNLPILDNVREVWPALSASYWRHVVSCVSVCDLSALRSFAPRNNTLLELEESGVMLHRRRCEVVLNPFFDFACFLRQRHPLWDPYRAWGDGDMISGQPFDEGALLPPSLKGKAMEAIVAWCMLLRTAFMRPDAMSFGTLIRLIAGPALKLSSPSKKKGSGDVVYKADCFTLSFGSGKKGPLDEVLKSLAKSDLGAPLVSFPCHSETGDNSKPRTFDDQKKHVAMARSFIAGHRGSSLRVAQPSAKYNQGCDVVVVGDLRSANGGNEGKCCIMITTKPSTSIPQLMIGV